MNNMAQLHYLDIDYETDDTFSGRDYNGRDMTEFELDNLVIYASVFSQEAPDTIVFNSKLTGATFIKCNLINVVVPDGNTVIDCNQTRVRTENDGRVWELNENDEPVKVCSEKFWIQRGASVDPADIPAEKLVLGKHEDLVTKLAEIQAAKEGLLP